MTVFAGALGLLFTDPNMSVAATFTPATGSAKAVRVIWRRPDEVWDGLQTGVAMPARVADVQASEIAAPAEGDQLTIGADTFMIDGVPRRDRDGLIWHLGLKPA